jgi:hypothetical protein
MTSDRQLVVVTIVKDDVAAFSKTMESVKSQTHPIRHITIDGSANTVNVDQITDISLHAGSIYFHQSARGIYSAMNFGLNMCRDNELVLFLNSGDCFAETSSVQQISKDIESSDSDLLIYPCNFGETYFFSPSIEGASAKNVANGRALICHQGVVASVQLIRNLGSFDETYAVSADHKLLLQLLQTTSPQIKNIPIALVSLGGVSDTNCETLVRENARARAETGMMLQSQFRDNCYTLKRLFRCRTKLFLRRILRLFGISSELAQRIAHRS